jgi:prepilin-type N-terminal cleavage/methylation domain-containing protein
MLEHYRKRAARTAGEERGFTLIELLVAIVVVAVLAAVAIVGIGSLTNNGTASACKATGDAARAASAVHYANHDSAYPATFDDMISTHELDATGLTQSADHLKLSNGSKWTLTMTAGSGTTAPSFACS